MPTEIIMPKLGWTMEEGTIARWLKSEGEEVEEGDPLLEVEADKATMEVEAPASGVLGRILVDEGNTVPVVQVIGYILSPGENIEDLPSEPPAVTEQRTKEETEGKVSATPVATRIANDRGINLQEVSGSGPAGEITKADVLGFAEKSQQQSIEERAHRKRISPRARRLAQEKGIDISLVEGSGPGGAITEEDVIGYVGAATSDIKGEVLSLKPIQRIAAERLTESFTSVPHFYLRVEVLASRLLEMREELLPAIKESSGVRLTITDLLLNILAKTLKDHPLANASWEKGRIRLAGDVNVGIATAVEDGLIVPVIKEADRKGLDEIAVERDDLTRRAAARTLSLEELENGTFTLSNLGMYGVDEFSSIINPPQSAILSVGQIANRAIVRDGQVVACPTMVLTLSIDHRVLDGARGARFLEDLRTSLERADYGID